MVTTRLTVMTSAAAGHVLPGRTASPAGAESPRLGRVSERLRAPLVTAVVPTTPGLMAHQWPWLDNCEHWPEAHRQPGHWVAGLAGLALTGSGLPGPHPPAAPASMATPAQPGHHHPAPGRDHQHRSGPAPPQPTVKPPISNQHDHMIDFAGPGSPHGLHMISIWSPHDPNTWSKRGCHAA
jgi:hypothetical protein